jgi:hypothetical protein
MAKTAKEKKYTPQITKRFLLIMDETVKNGICNSQAEFLTSIGEHRQNLPEYLRGNRAPTLEQLATACEKYGYSPTWALLGIGDKKMKAVDRMSIEDRVSELEAAVALLKKQVKRK